MRKQLQQILEQRVQQCVSSSRASVGACSKIERKKESLSKRNAEIVKAKATGKILKNEKQGDVTSLDYEVHFQYLIKHKGQLYLEEEVEQRVAAFCENVLMGEQEVNPFEVQSVSPIEADEIVTSDDRASYQYNRLKAVQYAERWWNDYNPAYLKFTNDCTNYISQCLHAGGAKMTGYPNRSKGWWMQRKNWSYSWAIANSLRLYLSMANYGLKTKQVSSPEELLHGDIICYDFQGNGRFDHNTIVTGKDADGMPLVNAHTTNSRMRYWAYEDSSAYTPNIKYKFYTIIDH